MSQIENAADETPSPTIPSPKRTFKRELPYKLTRDEVHDSGKRLARKKCERDAIDDKRKNVMAQYKGQLAEVDSEVDRLTAAVDTGEELRQVECGEYHEGSHKVVRRLDTLEEVDRAPLDWSDQQETLPGLEEPDEPIGYALTGEMVDSSTPGVQVFCTPDDDEGEAPAGGEEPVPPSNGAKGKGKRGKAAKK